MPDQDLLADLVLGNRILARHGVVDAFGHLSMRHPSDPGYYYISASIAPGQVTRDDLMLFDLESVAAHPDGRRSYVERFIHGEIYKARPDVGAIVHCHSPSLVAYAAVQRPLKPIYHMAGCLGDGCAHFDIRDSDPEGHGMLVESPEHGAALAACLGHSSVALMRGHGATIVAANVRQAVFRAVYVQMNASIASMAEQLGTARYLSDREAGQARDEVEGTAGRAWSYWVSELGADDRADAATGDVPDAQPDDTVAPPPGAIL